MTQYFRQASSLILCLLTFWIAGCTPIATNPPEASTPLNTTSPTLDDFWEGQAHFVMDVEDTGLPMGESDTHILDNGTWRSYVHASHQSLGVLDQCGQPVEFPGCLVTFSSIDRGRTFSPTVNNEGTPTCQIACVRCPCDSQHDHIDQQQYPQVARITVPPDSTQPNNSEQWLLTYEYRANIIVRRSSDGMTWSTPAEVPLTGIWQSWLMPCRPEAAIGEHPYTPLAYDCLVGSPPGIWVDQEVTPPHLYLFVGLGQNPSGMGCYHGPLNAPTALLRACNNNPLFVGASSYGPLNDDPDAELNANLHFDFRTISSADPIQVGNRYYLFYEGVRGPGPGDQGDTQFLLGLARSATAAIDGAWELYPGNPILLDLPGNVGVGHADVVVDGGETYLYTTVDGLQRSRLWLTWKP